MNEPLDFYGGPFSNFAPSEITLEHPFRQGEEIAYPSVEHYFQAMKATTASAHDWIASTPPWNGHADRPDCWEAKRRGRATELRPDWELVKYEVMLRGLREKFRIPEYRERLLASGEREIREDSPTDFEWGYRNGGRNLLGRALMQVRAEIQLGSEAR